jgi:hypothetical protein
MRFIDINVEFQQNANSKEEAIKSFSLACTACVKRGLYGALLECKNCQISVAHDITLSVFDDLEQMKKRA